MADDGALKVTVPVPAVNVPSPDQLAATLILVAVPAVNAVLLLIVIVPLNVSVEVLPLTLTAVPALDNVMLLNVCVAAFPLINWLTAPSKYTVPIPAVNPPAAVLSVQLAATLIVPAVPAANVVLPPIVTPPFIVSVAVLPPMLNAVLVFDVAIL